MNNIISEIRLYCDTHTPDERDELFYNIHQTMYVENPQRVICSECHKPYRRDNKDHNTGVTLLIKDCDCCADGQIIKSYS